MEMKYIPGTTCKCVIDQYVTYNNNLPKNIIRRARPGKTRSINPDYLVNLANPTETTKYIETLIPSQIKADIIKNMNAELGPFSTGSISSKCLLFKEYGSYCPQCILSFTSYINQQLVIESRCKIHDVELISRCPICGRLFDYYINISKSNPYKCKCSHCDYTLVKCSPMNLLTRIYKELNYKNYEKYSKDVKYEESGGYIAVFQGNRLNNHDCLSFLKKYLDTAQRNEPDFIINKNYRKHEDIKEKIVRFISKIFRTNVYGGNVYEILQSIRHDYNPEKQTLNLMLRKAFDIKTYGLKLVSGSTIQSRLIKCVKDSGVKNYIGITDKLLDMYVEDYFNTAVEMFRLYKCTVDDLIQYEIPPVEVGYEIVILETENTLETYGYLIPPILIKSLKTEI